MNCLNFAEHSISTGSVSSIISVVIASLILRHTHKLRTRYNLS